MTDIIPPPTVFVVDDDQHMRQSIKFLLQAEELDVETYPDAHAFLAAYRPDRPGCLVLDLEMPGMKGADLQEKLIIDGLNIPIIIITGHADVRVAINAMRAGAVDLLEKPFNDQDLLDRVRIALSRDLSIRRRDAERGHISRRLARLTDRERQVLDLICIGMASKQMAVQLNISEKTIEVHRRHILNKTGAVNSADLVRLIMESREKD